MPSPASDVDIAIHAARTAAQIIRPAIGTAVNTEWKGAVDPVTEVDRAAESAIVAHLAEARPRDAVIGEEGSDHGDADRRWVIDPIDGTVNFVHGIPHVAVSIGLWENDRPIVGVVLDVTRDEVFASAAGCGATCDGKPISVSSTPTLADAICGTGFPYDRRDRAAELTAQVARMLTRARAIRRMGSAALDLAWVAAGRYDAYWEVELQPWDLAAGLLLVTESGGTVTDLDGRPLGLTAGPVAASNGLVHRELLDAVAG